MPRHAMELCATDLDCRTGGRRPPPAVASPQAILNRIADQLAYHGYQEPRLGDGDQNHKSDCPLDLWISYGTPTSQQGEQ